MTSAKDRTPDFFDLSRNLLKGGIAPKYVKRTIIELQDHYTDLREAALNEGLSELEAESQARSSLGKEEDLLAEVLSKGELLSWTSRRPWIFYGLAPAVASFVLTVLFIFISVTPAGLVEMTGADVIPDAVIALINSGIFISINVLPMLVAAYVCYQVALRQDPVIWPILGLSLLCVVAVAIGFRVGWPTPEMKGSFSVSLGYPMNWRTLIRALLSVSCMALCMTWFQAKFNRQ